MQNNKEEYDFIFSIGEDCACTGYLREHHLQVFSYPFDWLTAASFETRIELLVNDFDNFLNIENLKFLPKNPQINTDSHCDYYANISTGFYFYHDFPAGESLEKNFKNVKEKYDRRIKRLYSKIQKARKILIVWLSRDKNIDDERLKSAYNQIVNKFPNKKIDFLILENDSSKSFLEKEFIEVTSNITKVLYDNATYDKSNPMAECMGNKESSNEIFVNYELKKSLFSTLKNNFILKLAYCLPKREWRKNFREKHT